MAIPVGYVVNRRTPVFTRDTVPPALLSAHETKGGTWGMIHVLEGKLRYCIVSPSSESILHPGQSGIIEPEIQHHVEPLGPVRFYLEFYRAP